MASRRPNPPGLLGAAGLQDFIALRNEAIEAVTARFYEEHPQVYAPFGERGRAACREDLGFHLEFLRPALEFGIIEPMADYLRWLADVLAKRDVPARHLALSLDWLAEFFVARMGPSDGRIVERALQAAKAQYLEKAASPPSMDARLPAPWPECAGFEAALLAGDRREATAVVEGLLAQGRSLIDAELHVIQPALYRIGAKWQANQVSVAQEHLATAIAQSVMVEGLIRSEPEAPNGRKVLLACVEGNHHAIGLLMVADAFQLAGWEVSYLGADTPTGSVVAFAQTWRPDLVGLSISLPQQLRFVREVIARMDAAFGARRPPVIVGGLAINSFDRLAERVGADAWEPDAAAAVTSGGRLATPGGRA